MHFRLDDLRKQARMLQMYEWERNRTRGLQDPASIQVSGPSIINADPGMGAEAEPRTGLIDPTQPID